MVNNIAPISGTTNSSANTSQATTYNNSQIQSMLMAGNLEPKFASMLIAQMSNNSVNDILFGSSSTDDNNDNSTDNFLGLSTSDISGNFSTSASNSNTDPLFASLGLNSSSSVSPQYEMSIYSNLIGKTVTAVAQSTGKEITGKVISVQYQNGIVTLDIGGIIAAASSIKIIKGE